MLQKKLTYGKTISDTSEKPSNIANKDAIKRKAIR